MATMLCDLLDKNYIQYITYIKDRLGHDTRYSIQSTKMNMNATIPLYEGLRHTVNFYQQQFLVTPK
jgi:dTDP-D-glucose 4,6-dehydratase